MRHPLIIFLLICLPALPSNSQEPVNIGTEHTFWSDTLQEERTYWIQLPRNYDQNPDQSYPVMVVLDGGAHFVTAAGVVSFMSRYHNIPDMLVLGIGNVNRERDFTPDKIQTVRENQTGGGDRFLHFLENELIPAVAKGYRLNGEYLLAGHSLGGLIACHAFMKQDTKFNAFIAIDPSFGTWDEEVMNNKVDNIFPGSFKRSLYLVSANSGERRERNEKRHQLFVEKLNQRSSKDFKLQYHYFENEVHRTVPLLAWYHGLRFLLEE